MNDEPSFHQALREGSEDDALWSAYADWLEERGERAENCCAGSAA